MDNFDNTRQQDTPPQQPVQPIEWSWIVQRQETPDAQANSMWKLGFIGPDGGEVRVTFHQVGNDQAQQAKKDAEKQAQTQQAAMMGMPPMSPATAFAPPGQPMTDATHDSTFYVTFFSNRAPHSFMNWDTSLAHEQSLQVWVTITHGIIDFIRKAQPANLILDDLSNGKLKMVLRSIAMDVVAGNPDYTIEQTQKNHYRTFFQIKKADVPSAFAAANMPDQEQLQPSSEKTAADQGPFKSKQNNEPGQGAPEQSNPIQTPGTQDVHGDKSGDNQMPQPTDKPPSQFPSNDPVPIKHTAPQQRGLTVEIGQDYSVAVKDKDGNAVDRYRAKGPLDILRWVKDKGYAGSQMVIVKREMPSKSVQKKIMVMQPGNASDTLIKPVIGSTGAVAESFTVEGTTIKMHKVIPAKQAAMMNYIVNASHVKCTTEAVEFVFETDKDMDFKKAIVELAYERTQNGHVQNKLRNIGQDAAEIVA